MYQTRGPIPRTLNSERYHGEPCQVGRIRTCVPEAPAAGSSCLRTSAFLDRGRLPGFLKRNRTEFPALALIPARPDCHPYGSVNEFHRNVTETNINSRGNDARDRDITGWTGSAGLRSPHGTCSFQLLPNREKTVRILSRTEDVAQYCALSACRNPGLHP